VAGIAASVLAAYAAVKFNNIMDLLQLVFAFVNAPLFGTFLFGMFWKRATGHGAFWGLLLGTVSAALHHGLTLPAHSVPGLKGGWMGVVAHYPSEMAQNFWTAIWAFSVCFVATFVISLVTAPRSDEELRGLVYSLTDRPKSDGRGMRPELVAVIILATVGALNLYFW
jgi:SSS family solute:Na+ symporter